MIQYAMTIGLEMVGTTVLAYQCPAAAGKIDAALAKNPQLSSADMAKVKELCANGEQLHESGNYADAVGKRDATRAGAGLEKAPA